MEKLRRVKGVDPVLQISIGTVGFTFPADQEEFDAASIPKAVIEEAVAAGQLELAVDRETTQADD